MEINNEKKEELVEKIKKTLALANNNKNPNEAQAAMLMVQKMMAKYHIEMQELENIEDEEVQEDEVNIKRGSWRKMLIKIVCNNYRCDCFLRGTTGKRIIIVGDKDDIEIAKTIYKFAEKQLLDGFNSYFKNYYEEHTDIQTKNAARKDYADGFIDGLKEKFARQKESETKKDNQFALVLTNKKVEEYMESLNFRNNYRMRNSSPYTDPLAFSIGRSKGLNMQDLHSCIEERNIERPKAEDSEEDEEER